ncbi:hypothetical protein PISMIDRAFT_11939 [Pisolithus microcarpus 441]|uniref:Unplaced genomic scaffold scaffold_61, whole genome shotgun sequence n=1 Tax=Pisolithus microcarpus 441 TaxID=765257 RepID=A0A0C9ZQB7_9AGAM|nr:hypothetical protein BKA83DRAFT_11939 [Pisolithus microcarpus]KIK21918.1 hypothetical protein PISMIDRAFT_11939 [Pisolithus microcarpus 441]
MQSTGRLLSERVHRPLIHFIGKRVWSTPGTSHPHPAGPSDTPAAKQPPAAKHKSVFQHFWEAPPRLWNPRYHNLEQAEIDSIQSGGASLL